MAYKKSYKSTSGSNSSSKGARLPQYGGEGTESYMGTKSDMNLAQHGGEGTAVSKKTDTKLLSPSPDYCGPGRYI